MPNDAFVSTLGSAISSFPGAAQSITGAQSDIANVYFAERNYRRNRRDALADWDRVNAYNSPAAQMQRFRDAGLNPNLIYGRGSAGDAGAVGSPEAVAPSLDTTKGKSAPVDVMGNLLAQADLKIKAAQANNLNVQTDVIREEANLKRVQAQRAGFDLAFETEMRPFSADARRENVRQVRTSTDLSLREDARRASLNSSNLAEALERMLNMQQSRYNMILDRSKTYSEIRRNESETARAKKHIELMDKDGTLRNIEIDLRNKGINPNDPGWQRELLKLYYSIFDSSPGGVLDR